MWTIGTKSNLETVVNEIRKQKSDIRDMYIAKRREMDTEKRKALDNTICEKIIASATYRFADVILAYMPKEDEINIRPILEKALSDNKKVAFPICEPDSKKMDFHFVNSLDELTIGTYGILEPSIESEMYSYEKYTKSSVICIVPAIVYDKKGYRIGYGGGYYDRYLSSFKGTTLGLAYYDFILKSVPKGRFDFAVDVLLSERGIYAKK